MNILKNYALKSLNTFGIEASAACFSTFSSVQELTSILSEPQVRDMNKLILGGGSNILFTQNFDGLVLKNNIKGIRVVSENAQEVLLQAGAGEVWHDLVMHAVHQNMGGLENLSLIPGTVGASPIQNIGAYGVELKDVFESLEALDIQSLNLKKFSISECDFGYRDSVFKNKLKGKFVITSVTFRLQKNPGLNISYGAIKDTLQAAGIEAPTIQAVSDAVVQIRRSKLPDPAVIGNAGSFFKNPEIEESQFLELKKTYPDMPSYPTVPGKVKVPAGWLNEQCGWKGKTIGQAGVHKNQALVLVNYGGAKGADIKQLAKDIQASVLEKFGIAIETEVNIL